MGLIHALRSSAEVALGDDDTPLRAHAARDGVRGLKAAERSLGLLEMLHAKTAGNLGETERDTLWTALRTLRSRIEAARQRLEADDTEADDTGAEDTDAEDTDAEDTDAGERDLFLPMAPAGDGDPGGGAA